MPEQRGAIVVEAELVDVTRMIVHPAFRNSLRCACQSIGNGFSSRLS